MTYASFTPTTLSADRPLEMLPEHRPDRAIAVLCREPRIHERIPALTLVAPPALRQPKLSLHHELHAIDVRNHRRIAGQNHVIPAARGPAHQRVHEPLMVVHHHGKDDDVVGIYRALLLIEQPARPAD